MPKRRRQRTRRNVGNPASTSRTEARVLADGFIIIGTKRITVPGTRIPTHTQNPKVSRWLRLEAVLTASSPSFTVSYLQLAQQDQADYSSPGVRFTTIRCLRARCWLETAAPSGTTGAVELLIQDPSSSVVFRSKSVGTDRYAAVGMIFSLEIRQALQSVGSGGVVLSTTSLGITLADAFNLTVDVLCELN